MLLFSGEGDIIDDIVINCDEDDILSYSLEGKQNQILYRLPTQGWPIDRKPPDPDTFPTWI